MIPIYGLHEMTYRLVKEIHRERKYSGLDVIIVDNHDPRNPDRDVLNFEGPYQSLSDERVVRSGENLGWARACNLGIEFASKEFADDRSCHGVVVLNNDVELSQRFFVGLIAASEKVGVGLTAPTHNGDWSHHALGYEGEASQYRPENRDHPAPFADGTCILVPWGTFKQLGSLREGPMLDPSISPIHGWGLDMFLGHEVRNLLGLRVMVTELSYLLHERGVTARLLDPKWETFADLELKVGLTKLFGLNWVDVIWKGFPLPHSYADLIKPPSVEDVEKVRRVQLAAAQQTAAWGVPNGSHGEGDPVVEQTLPQGGIQLE
ncbi:MAG: glycosyltransferase [Candidatus Dormibacteraceae bacterium]